MANGWPTVDHRLTMRQQSVLVAKRASGVLVGQRLTMKQQSVLVAKKESHLEHCAQCWASQLQTDGELLGRAQ